jgi:nitrogen fixation-related uncharacterized protein
MIIVLIIVAIFLGVIALVWAGDKGQNTPSQRDYEDPQQ